MLKSVAIISCGPSAADLYNADIGYDLIIGVRDRPAQVRCDWWVFCDWQSYIKHPPLVRPVAFTTQVTIKSMANHNLPKWEEFQTYPKMYVESGDQPPTTHRSRWHSWSGTAALGLAWKLGRAQGMEPGAQIHLYGYDLLGASDAAGVADETNRTEHRWEAERGLTDELIGLLEIEGWEVIRFE